MAVIVKPGTPTVGFVKPIEIRMPGVTDSALAAFIAARELAARSRPRR